MIVLAVLLALALVATVWLFLRYLKDVNSSHEARVSELLTRIQHPEIVRPDVTPERTEPLAPVFNDDIHMVGTISHQSSTIDE